MAIDKNKKRLVFLTHDQIWHLKSLIQMHLDENGAPIILQKYPVSEAYAEDLRNALKAMQKVLDEIWETEDDSNGE